MVMDLNRNEGIRPRTCENLGGKGEQTAQEERRVNRHTVSWPAMSRKKRSPLSMAPAATTTLAGIKNWNEKVPETLKLNISSH